MLLRRLSITLFTIAFLLLLLVAVMRGLHCMHVRRRAASVLVAATAIAMVFREAMLLHQAPLRPLAAEQGSDEQLGVTVCGPWPLWAPLEAKKAAA